MKELHNKEKVINAFRRKDSKTIAMAAHYHLYLKGFTYKEFYDSVNNEIPIEIGLFDRLIYEGEKEC